ncbi:DUF1488 domain-containing protein [Pelagibius litoralis]|uniref:DUF1488 domain-containing protein n=1 Tax=Pelagibius litoralis TaxID=374515 RepID=A0A967EYJ5_9PROT|nr:DUF1488 domain-containing protein [Pelagibius litoralis]NIA69786.1 DUF1488 domain-containing protein [Pelagibius litoralis]
MTLNFPNESRSYDARRNVIRFWGYDSALEVSFLVEVNALSKPDPLAGDLEAVYLEAFDAARDRIYDTARKVYARTRDGVCLLSAADF